MHSNDIIKYYFAAVSMFLRVFKAFPCDTYLTGASLLNQAVQKLSSNMKEFWSLLTVKKHWVKPTLIDLNDWMKEKAEARDLIKQTSAKPKTEDNNLSATKNKVDSKVTSKMKKGNQEIKFCCHWRRFNCVARFVRVTIACENAVSSETKIHSARKFSCW